MLSFRGTRTAILHALIPLGIASAEVLSLLAHNQDEVGIAEGARPLAVTLAGALVIWSLLALVGGTLRAAIVASLAAMMFWGASALGTTASAWTGGGEWAGSSVTGALWVGLIPVAIAILRKKREPRVLAYVLAAAAAGSVAIPLATILQASLDPVGNAGLDEPAFETGTTEEERPDIYLIVLDAQGRDDELRKYFGVEPGLGQLLQERGFYVAERGASNYTTTIHSLASMLNYDYLRDLGGDEMSSREVHVLIRNSRAVRQLRRHGYSIGTCSSGFSPSAMWKSLDRHIRPPAPQVAFGRRVSPTAFENLLLRRTPIAALVRRTEFLSPYLSHRARILHCLDTLPTVATDPKPTFMLAHVLAPHEPFVFGENGEDTSPYHMPYDIRRLHADLRKTGTGPEPSYAEKYRAQARYVAKLTVRAVDRIAAQSPSPPIIVVMGDHGPKGFRPHRAQARFAILNAYSLPARGHELLYPTITPVNTFRLILSHYFELPLELLPDRLFRSDYGGGFRFKEWTFLSEGEADSLPPAPRPGKIEP